MAEPPIKARLICLSGLVQGVGFRPFVWRWAHACQLCGWVRNSSEGVQILVQGEPNSLQSFIEGLRARAPDMARITTFTTEAVPLVPLNGFVIADSVGIGQAVHIGADTAPCPACLAEFCNPADRRWRHAFINCTQCGPRYTLTRALPYDRSRTSMAGFALCAQCNTEYTLASSRRFHAEPICCPQCGPQLRLRNATRHVLAGDPIAQTLDLLHAGAVVAIKGLGGFHLVCDARRADVVARLRQRKHREAKPLAVMALNLASLAAVVQVDEQAQRRLQDPSRPIVLCPTREPALPGIAPGLAQMGVMLPVSPLQYLLWHESAGRPAGTDWLQAPHSMLLVMTSANPGGEPIVIDNEEAGARLAGMADAYLEHDRDIVARCDDSVEAGHTRIRRARGQVPEPIGLARSGPSVLALGGWFKNTVCLTRGQHAFLSAHIGDLDNAATLRFLEESVAHLQTVTAARPDALACDLHPDFASSHLAATLSQQLNLPLIRVQHHHAHVGAVLAEYGVEQAVLGLALDGIGYGPEGQAWGGELLHVQGAQCRHLGGLSPLPLPGGDRAAREPWRMASAVLWRGGRTHQISQRFGAHAAADSLPQLFGKPNLAPPTSSLGRVFDAAAALLNIRHVSHFEGQAAMELEALALRHGPVAPWRAGWAIQATGSLDLLPLLLTLADEPDAGFGAALFHATLVQALIAWVNEFAERTGLHTVVGGGGCLLNGVLAEGLTRGFAQHKLKWYLPKLVPPNDGGLSLGQAWIARQLISQ